MEESAAAAPPGPEGSTTSSSDGSRITVIPSSKGRPTEPEAGPSFATPGGSTTVLPPGKSPSDESPEPDAEALRLRISVPSSSRDHGVAQLRLILERFFQGRGYALDPDTPVEVSTVIPVAAYEDPQDLIDLHPTAEDEVNEDADDVGDRSFDVVRDVAEFERRGKFS